MRLLLHALMLLSTAVTGRARAQAAADSSAIRATALDYAEGWYEGNADQMARALHPELVKRIVVRDTTTGKTMVQGMGASVLVNSTRHGYGKETPKGFRCRFPMPFRISFGRTGSKICLTPSVRTSSPDG